jgi:diketogulonate reductase-like aldo/keto reductase
VEERNFGPTGRNVAVIGQGTWQLRSATQAQEALRRGLELGMTHIDTAELYRGSEEAIQPVIQDRRDDVFLVSKVMPSNAGYETTLRSCKRSLERLGITQLDVYLLHWWPSEDSTRECMRAMGTLIDDGLIRHAGVSNFGIEELEVAMEALAPQEIACNQVLYHLNERSIEVELLPYCRGKNIAVVGYTPFGRPFPRPGSAQGKVLAEIASRHGKTPRQVALRFLTREAPLFTIPKSEQVAHTEENAGGQGWNLTNGDLAAIEDAFPAPERVQGVPML